VTAQLVGGNALLAAVQEAIGQKPLGQGNFAVLEDGPDRHGELLATGVAH